MKMLERFIKYIAIDTQSDPDSGKHPSTPTQIDFARMLVQDLKDVGVKEEDIVFDKYSYVYARVDNGKKKTIGLIAHMDTAPDFKGGINHPQVLENYNGKDIKLNESMTLSTAKFPFMKKLKGETLVVTDGRHLLGGDDKAGLAIIFEFVKYYVQHKDEFNYNLAVCFTPDEEIGEGPLFFDKKIMKADVAFTLDGESIYEANTECFNASRCEVNIDGYSIHPGNAKGVMVNAGLVATFITSLLPIEETPATTDGYDGFIHLTNIEGNVEHANLKFIIRDHDIKKLKEKENKIKSAIKNAAKVFPNVKISCTFKDEYKNMGDYFIKDPTSIHMINKAYLNQKVKLEYVPIRGGTDGATITSMGLPCLNLGTGTFNPHGPYEFVSYTQMKKMLEIIKEIFKGTIL